MIRFPALLSSILFLAVHFGYASATFAQDVSVEAALLSERIAVGETGSLIIRTVNGAPDSLPRAIQAPGLTITKSHEQFVQSSDPVRGNVSEYLFYYQVTGQAEGTFKIPPQTIRVNNQNLATEELEITVFARKPGDEVLDAKRPYFSKLDLSQTEFYAGQMIPAELKVYVRGLRSIHDIGRPKLKHEQIVVRGFTQAETDALQLDGIPFSTASLAGSLFVLTPGEYAVGPADLDVRMLESSRFGSIGFFQSTTVRTLQSDAVPVVVKPLPEAGKPASFRGAVGQFQMKVAAKPTTLKVGDPISLDFEITGIGNLDSIEAPVFTAADPDAWRTYDARKTIDPAEESDGATSGRLTFSQIVMPRTQATEIPPFELAFFNPKTGAYVTQQTDPIPLTVAADDRLGPSAVAATVPAVGGGAFNEPAAVTPEASFDAPLFISLAEPNWRSSAVPPSMTSRPGFWLAQAIPSIALFTIIGLGVTRFARDRAARRTQAESALTFANALGAIPNAGRRGDHYDAVEDALDAWLRETQTPADQLPDAAKSGHQALQSRCQWILYGAPDDERERAIEGAEASENRQILDALSAYLG